MTASYLVQAWHCAVVVLCVAAWVGAYSGIILLAARAAERK